MHHNQLGVLLQNCYSNVSQSARYFIYRIINVSQSARDFITGCQCITICIEFYYRLIDTLQLVKGFITDTLQYAVH